MAGSYTWLIHIWHTQDHTHLAAQQAPPGDPRGDPSVSKKFIMGGLQAGYISPIPGLGQKKHSVHLKMKGKNQNPHFLSFLAIIRSQFGISFFFHSK